MSNEIKHIICDEMQKPLPVYSHAVAHHGLLYISAVQGFIPGTFDISDKASEQAEIIMHNLGKLLQLGHSNFDRIIKMNIFFTDIDNDFYDVNHVVNQYIPQYSPARSSLGGLTLPRGASVVMDFIAAIQTQE
jgi:2-iminobutanoate/2-iminopropanoate deaminase